MFKILTILTLLYLLNSSVLSKAENNKGTYSAESEDQNQQLKGLQPSVVESGNRIRNKRDAGSCGRENGDEPGSESLTNKYNLDSKPIQRNHEDNDEVYFIEHPEHTHGNFLRSDNKNDDASVPNIQLEKQNPQLRRSESNNDPDSNFDEELRPKYGESNEPSGNEPATNQQIGSKADLNEVETQNSQTEKEENRDEESKVDQNCPSSDYSANRRSNNEPLLLNNNGNQNKYNVEPEIIPKTYFDANRHNTKFGLYGNQLADPASGSGVSTLADAGVNLLQHNRVCYACSSANNPTCLQPDRRTTVKYCLKGHEACVTKTYQMGKNRDTSIVIRDCGVSCDDTDIPGPEYKSCKVCNADVCNNEPFNGAISIKSDSVLFGLFIIFAVKYTM